MNIKHSLLLVFIVAVVSMPFAWSQTEPPFTSPVVMDISEYFRDTPGVKSLEDGSFYIKLDSSMITTPTIPSPIPFDSVAFMFELMKPDSLPPFWLNNGFYINASTDNEQWSSWLKLQRQHLENRNDEYKFVYYNKFEWRKIQRYLKIGWLPPYNAAIDLVLCNPRLQFYAMQNYLLYKIIKEESTDRAESVLLDIYQDILDSPGLGKNSSELWHMSDEEVTIFSRQIRAPFEFNFIKLTCSIPEEYIGYDGYQYPLDKYVRYSKDGVTWSEWSPMDVLLYDGENEALKNMITLLDRNKKQQVAEWDYPHWNYVQFKLISRAESPNLVILHKLEISFFRYAFQTPEEFDNYINNRGE